MAVSRLINHVVKCHSLMCIKRFNLLAFIIFMSLNIAPMSQANAENRLIIIIRHAEKTNVSAKDPPLSPQGVMRATSLITALHRSRYRNSLQPSISGPSKRLRPSLRNAIYR